MPSTPKRPCRHPGCAALSNNTYCEEHRARYNRRESATARGYDARWRRERLRFLRHNPLCVTCRSGGRLTPANVVDHIVPHRGNEELFWDQSNWQALCKPCHDKKTATEDGGFGNTVRR